MPSAAVGTIFTQAVLDGALRPYQGLADAICRYSTSCPMPDADAPEDDAGRARQLYPLADRAWRIWVPRALDHAQLAEKASHARSHYIRDPDSAFRASELAAEYLTALEGLPPPVAPWTATRPHAPIVLAQTRALLAIVGRSEGTIALQPFEDAVRHAAEAFVALCNMALRQDLKTQVCGVMSGAEAAAD